MDSMDPPHDLGSQFEYEEQLPENIDVPSWPCRAGASACSCKCDRRRGKPMIKHPKLKSHLHSEVIDKDKTLLIAEGRCFALYGRVYTSVLPLIDGQLATDEIVDRLQHDISQTEIYHAILSLERFGHIEEASAVLTTGTAGFWNTLGISTRSAIDWLASRAVCVTGLGDVPLENLISLLGDLGIQLGPPEHAALWVALVDD